MAQEITASGSDEGSRRSLLLAVWAQFFGSDLETGYTFIYTWLANQFGHFMIGFAGTLFWLWLWSLPVRSYDLLSPKTSDDVVAVGGLALLWFVIWIGKEFGSDVAGGRKDLRDARDRRKAVLKQAADGEHEKSEESFKRDLTQDSLIDIWFYFSGILTALMMLYGPTLATMWERPWLAGLLPLLTFIILLLLSVPISAKWLRRNIAFDMAQLPFVSRFALSDRPFRNEIRERAIDFALDRKKTGHLVIIGPPKSGRTTIAVALGVEALLHCSPPSNTVRYITLCKLLDRIVEGKPKTPRPVYPPEEAELLIVDDVGAQTSSPTDPLLSSHRFGTLLEDILKTNTSLRAAVKKKRVIWVVGDDPDQATEWQRALETKDAFGPNSCAGAVVLAEEIPLEIRRRPMAHAKGATRGQGSYLFASRRPRTRRG